MEQDHTQLAQELVDHIIDFLSDSSTDLKACALVSHTFVYAAQSHIFNEISIGFGASTPAQFHSLWSRLQATLHVSPHLVQHIRRLRLQPRRISPETLSAICNFPFTHLQTLLCANFNLLPASAIALQQLFSLPSLRSVEIVCRVGQPSDFLQIWDRFSPNVTHLDLTCYHITTEAFHVVPHHCTAPIRLNSLRIAAAEGVRDWVNHPLCPFDFSSVTGLSVFTCTDVLQWPKFLPLVPTISVLSFYASVNKPAIDLSAFLNLTLLRIGLYPPDAWPNARQTLSTIPPSNRIRKIVLVGSSYVYDVNAEELDSTLSSLHMHHLQPFEFEMEPDNYDLLSRSLPRLTSKNMVRRTDDDPNWFKRAT
ncbi:hypothetical protein FB451DRAFT_1214051, partial [Mycena latifolia]